MNGICLNGMPEPAPPAEVIADQAPEKPDIPGVEVVDFAKLHKDEIIPCQVCRKPQKVEYLTVCHGIPICSNCKRKVYRKR